MQFADRLIPLSSNVFADMDMAKAIALQAGQHLIDLSLGSSDLPTSPFVLEAIATALQDRNTHGYALFQSTRDFRVAVAQWMERKFGVSVDPETEVLPLIGSQEGTAHLPLAILNPGDFALLQDPGYPSHYGGIHLASGQVYGMPLLAANGFLPVFADIPATVLAQAKMMVLSYPHNPTTAIAPLVFFEQAVAFCQEHNLALVHDFPYVDLVFEPPLKKDELDPPLTPLKKGELDPPLTPLKKGGEQDQDWARVPSMLQADRERSVTIEFFTMSKSYNMGGFRIGFAVGNRELIKALRQVKAAVDFNQYRGIMRGAIAALLGDQSGVNQMVQTFQQRRDAMIEALAQIGWEVPSPTATMYLWAKLPDRLPDAWKHDSVKFCIDLVQTTGIALSPGAGFGKYGEGYVRFALVHSPAILREAAQRIGKIL